MTSSGTSSPSARASSPTITSATSARGPWPAPRNLSTYRPSSSASTRPGSEPPSRSGGHVARRLDRRAGPRSTAAMPRLSSIDDMLLSVLDQSPIAEGSTGAQALRNTLDLAQLTDALGYHRYWVAEHHGGPMLAGPSPEVLIGPIAAATEAIRVGSGGVMLPHYSPLKVAESFTILAAPVPRPDRPRPRPRRRHRPADHLRPAARPPPGRARRLPAAARRAARPTSRTTCPRTIPSATSPQSLPGLPELPAAVAARLLAAERDLGRASSGCATRSPTSSTPAAPRSPSIYRERFAPVRDLQAPARRRRRLGAVRADRRGGPAPGRLAAGWRSRCCAAAS